MHETGLRMKASLHRCRLWEECPDLENPVFSNAGMGHLCTAGGMAQ